MLDLIDRQDAIDEIHKDKIDSYTIKCMSALGNGNEALTVNMTCDRHIQLLKNLPSAQPEVIRCKDCKNWDTTWRGNWAGDSYYCPNVDGVRGSDFYCADAERRTDG